MSDQHLAYLPAHDNHPGAAFSWSEDSQPNFTRGVEMTQAWLDDPNSGWLWTNLLLERQRLSLGPQRHAFELVFLSRIHQRLCPPLGGSHLARRTALKL